MATTRVDQRTVIERTAAATPPACWGGVERVNHRSADPMVDRWRRRSPRRGDRRFRDADGRSHDSQSPMASMRSSAAESLLYAGYAQHYLLTYFPAAYPRWYLDGFGQIFASFATKGKHYPGIRPLAPRHGSRARGVRQLSESGYLQRQISDGKAAQDRLDAHPRLAPDSLS